MTATSGRRPRRIETISGALSAALALALVGCAPASTSRPEGSTVGVVVQVEPAAPQMAPSTSLTFAAVVQGAISTAVTWSVTEASGGTVDSSGLYTAPAATGTYHVVATSTAAPQSSGQAVVTVTPAPVIAVAITTRDRSVQVGRTLQLLATVSGTTAGQSTAVTWAVEEAAGGTVGETTGLYTPPATTGTYHVVATSVADGTKTDRTSVVVIPASQAGDPPPKAPRVAASIKSWAPSTTLTGPTLAVSGLGQAAIWWDRSQDSGGYDTRTGISTPTYYSRPVDYVIEATSNGTTFTTLLTVTGNTYFTRGHIVDLTGYTGVRMRITNASNTANYHWVDIAVHDVRDGAGDWWVFFGDSVTDNVFVGSTGQFLLGNRYGDNIHARDATRWPIAHNGGVSAGTMNHYLQNVGGRPLFTTWMEDFPGKYVSLGIGVNDINGYSDHAITTAELDVMQGKMEQLITIAQAAGKTVVLPAVRWTNTNPYTGVNIAAWNARLWNTILPRFPGAIRGADIYTNALAQGTAGLRADNTHLTEAGALLTQGDWADWAMADVY